MDKRKGKNPLNPSTSRYRSLDVGRTGDLEKCKLNQDLDKQKARADKLLDELSRLPNADLAYNIYNKRKNNFDAKIHDNENNISQLKEYTDFTDTLEEITIKASLDAQKARVDKLLDEHSHLPNNHEELQKWRMPFDNIENKVSDDRTTINSKRDLVNAYTYFANELEEITINESLNAQKARVDKLLDEHSHLTNNHEELPKWRMCIDNIENKVLEDFTTINSKRELVNIYTLFANELDQININKSLDAQKVIVDKLLDEHSHLTNNHEELQKYRMRFDNIENNVLDDSTTTNSKRYLVNIYTYFANQLDKKNIDIRLSQQTQEFNHMLKNTSLLEKNEKSEFEAINAAFVSEFRSERLEKQRTSLTNYAPMKQLSDLLGKRLNEEDPNVDNLQKEVDYSSNLNEKVNNWLKESSQIDSGSGHGGLHSKFFTRSENASTSDSQTKGEITEVKHSNSAATQNPDSAGAREIPEWRIDLRKAQISRWNRAMDFLNRRVGKETRLHRPDRVKQIVREINEELKDIRQALSSKNPSSDRTNATIKQIVLDETAKIVKEIRDHSKQALQNYGRGDKDRANRKEGEELLGKHCRDLQNIKDRYLAGKILAVESGTSTFMKELTGQDKINYERTKGPIKNEDALIQDKLHSIYAVLDGVGGYSGGDVASNIAKNYFEQNSHIFTDNMPLDEVKTTMEKSLRQANEKIQTAQKETKFSAMGTTASVVKIMKDGMAVIGNIGDSRVYLLREGSQSVEHLTIDDGYLSLYSFNKDFNKKIQKAIAQLESFDNIPSYIPPAAIRCRNIVSQSLGANDIEPNIYTHQLLPGDRLIIMSDGIHDNLTDKQIADCLSQNPHHTQEATKALVEKAKEVSEQGTSRSKADDMTAIVVKY